MTRLDVPSELRRARAVGRLLRSGVILAAALIAVGAVPYLAGRGLSRPDYGVFRPEPPVLRSASGILRDALSGDAAGIIQLGFLVLLATPVARVAFLLGAFARAGDRLYVVVSALVLAVLAFSLLGSGFL